MSDTNATLSSAVQPRRRKMDSMQVLQSWHCKKNSHRSPIEKSSKRVINYDQEKQISNISLAMYIRLCHGFRDASKMIRIRAKIFEQFANVSETRRQRVGKTKWWVSSTFCSPFEGIRSWALSQHSCEGRKSAENEPSMIETHSSDPYRWSQTVYSVGGNTAKMYW